MPELLAPDGVVRYRLRSTMIVGRGAQCDIRITHDQRVSRVHARISWNGSSWEVKDLASTHGTFVYGRRLEAGERAPLPAGAALGFGTPGAPPWRLEAADPPPLCAERADPANDLPTGVIVEADGERLLLPTIEAPELAVFPDGGGGWCLEDIATGQESAVRDGDRVTARDARWILHLPEARRTIDQDQPPARLDDLRLRFIVRRGESHVAIEASSPHGTLDLGAYVAYYPLLHLGRCRVRDRGADVPESEAGWRLQEEVLDELKMSRYELFSHTHRARAYFARRGVVDSQRLVERRRDSGELRLGVRAISIDEFWHPAP